MSGELSVLKNWPPHDHEIPLKAFGASGRKTREEPGATIDREVAPLGFVS
jgi:hypothetical protein